MTDPAITALLDQADAAGRQAHGYMHALADHFGDRAELACGPGTGGPITAAMLDRISARATGGTLTLCPHLDYTRPAVAHWVAWSPGRVRCAPCSDRAGKRIKGKREDFVCDHCRAYHDPLHPVVVNLPPIVVPALRISVPAVLIHYGLCPDCHAVEVGADA